MVKCYRVEVLGDDVKKYASSSTTGGGGYVTSVNGVTYGEIEDVRTTITHHTDQAIWVRDLSVQVLIGSRAQHYPILKEKMKILVSAFVLFASFSAIAADNGFFSGYAKGCVQTKEYENFRRSLCKQITLKDESQICLKGKVFLPPGMNGTISKMENKPEYSYFVVTLDKPVTYAGNTIIAIDQLSGHENGIQTSSLLTDSNVLSDVKKKIKASGTIFKKSKLDVSEPNFAQVIKNDYGKVNIVCDTSN